MKTESEIKTSIYKLVFSSLSTKISGIVTKRKRPLNSEKEDIVISILSSKIGQEQTFIINVNIYVKDIDVNGQKEEDSLRLEELSKLAIELFESKKARIGNGFLSELQEQHTLEVESINHHCINNKLLIKHLNK